LHILKVGFNYKTSPVEIREKLSFSEHALHEAMNELKERKSILENVIISTCNRTEVYAVVDQLHTGRYYIKTFLSEWFQIDPLEFSSYIQIAENDAAMEHLFRVTTGLDSMVLGETEILGQVKDAFLHAQKIQTTGTIFNELFKQAITFGKRIHHETAISEHAVSISYTAVELAKQHFGGLNKKHITILGAGKMGQLAAKNVLASGADAMTILNRTFSKADELARVFAAKAEPVENLVPILHETDILISSTSAPEIVLTKEMLKPVLNARKGKPLLLLDIAVPRDIDSSINMLNDVSLYDIDDLQNIVDENLDARKKAAVQVELLLQDEIGTFKEWLQTLGVVPIISALRQKALNIQTETMNSIERKMPDLTEREKKVLSKHTKSIINQLLKEPITQAKELAGQEHAESDLQLFIDIFGIDEEVRDEFQKQMDKNKVMKKRNQEVKSPVSSV
jgi:glutamyl-tRNA reductase